MAPAQGLAIISCAIVAGKQLGKKDRVEVYFPFSEAVVPQRKMSVTRWRVGEAALSEPALMTWLGVAGVCQVLQLGR